jgi:hypothetical protein
MSPPLFRSAIFSVGEVVCHVPPNGILADVGGLGDGVQAYARYPRQFDARPIRVIGSGFGRFSSARATAASSGDISRTCFIVSDPSN